MHGALAQQVTNQTNHQHSKNNKLYVERRSATKYGFTQPDSVVRTQQELGTNSAKPRIDQTELQAGKYLRRGCRQQQTPHKLLPVKRIYTRDFKPLSLYTSDTFIGTQC